MKNSIENLKTLDKIWKKADKGAVHVSIEGFPNITSYIYNKMEEGEDLTKIFQKIKKISNPDSLQNAIIYFKNRIRNFFNKDRERALNLYNIPLKPKKISVFIDNDGNVKISEYKNYLPCVKEIEGMPSRKFFIKKLEESKTPGQIIEYLKKIIPKNDLPASYNNFIHQFRTWTKDHREYLLDHFGIPIDAPYRIKPNADFTTQIEISIKGFCTKRLNQGISLETFAKTALNQVPEEKRKGKWTQICRNINSFAKKNSELFQKLYGIRIDDKFSAAQYLSSRIDVGFKKQNRKHTTLSKYSIEGMPLKNFIQKQLDNSPKPDINDLFNKIAPLYPKNHKEIKNTIGRCAKAWISNNPHNPQCKNVANSLEKFNSALKTSHPKTQLLKDILKNKEIEQCKRNYIKNSQIEIQKGKEGKSDKNKKVNEHTLNTTISRMKRIIKFRIENPSATFNDLRLIAKRTLSKSALNIIITTPIKDLKKLKIVEKR